MNTSTSTINKPLFYFNNVQQLADFESFEVQPFVGDHDSPALDESKADWWSVVGKLKAGNAFNHERDIFPVADFHNEQYAKIFAQMCSKFASPGDDSTGEITDGFGQVLIA